MSDPVLDLLKEINTKVDDMVGRVITMEAYQKTHWQTLKDHKEKFEDVAETEELNKLETKVDNIEVRVRKNENGITRANTLYAMGIAALTAWIGSVAEIFKSSS